VHTKAEEHTSPLEATQYLTGGVFQSAYGFTLFSTATSSAAQGHRIAPIGKDHILVHLNSKISLGGDLWNGAVHSN